MKFGVLILPEHSWSMAKNLWTHAEALGFDHAWTYDHLAWKSLRDSPWYGAIPTLSAVAATTKRMRLGTLVASPNFRHPVTFAKDLITLDTVSQGRVTIGIGAGANGWDTTMLGQALLSKGERANRFHEFVELLHLLLSNSTTTWQGRYYSAQEAKTIPGCVQRPRIPFAIAATGKRGMQLAARFGDIWVTTGDRSVKHPLLAKKGAKVVQQQMALLDEHCQQVGREPATLRRLVLTGPSLQAGITSPQAFDDTLGYYAETGVTDFVLHWPRQQEPYKGDLKMFENIMSSYLDRNRDSPNP